MGRYEEALPPLQEAARRNPAFDRIQLILAATYAALGRIDDAEWAIDELLLINPDLSLAVEREQSIYRRESDLEHVDGLHRPDWPVPLERVLPHP